MYQTLAIIICVVVDSTPFRVFGDSFYYVEVCNAITSYSIVNRKLLNRLLLEHYETLNDFN